MDTSSVISQIGNTPLIKLKQASELTGCNIYGKAVSGSAWELNAHSPKSGFN